VYKNKSLLGNHWHLQNCEERLILSLSQRYNISPILSKFLLIRNIDINYISEFLYPHIKNDLPNPFALKDMEKSIMRTILSIKNNQKIGIIADYDVDGSTSATILYKFLTNFTKKITIKIPQRLTEGYGPNIRIMDELLNENINLIFTLDCGTSSFNIIDNAKYSKMDVIVIDHHLSQSIFPKVYSIINPNRYDENGDYDKMAAVGVTFLFLMGLRKKLRDQFYFKKLKEPNLLLYLDLVSLGTVCDVVDLVSYNRVFVKTGLFLIKERLNKSIAKMIDNSSLNSTPTSRDLGFIIGPQLNAASRIDDSSLPSKLLVSNNILEIDSISKKLSLLNEKRKLIENTVFEEALLQTSNQKNQNFILVYENDWHRGVLGIVASKLINLFHKPTIVISFINNIGVGSARSIKSIDLGNIILQAKKNNILLEGGGHKIAAGLKIQHNLLNEFSLFLKDNLEALPQNIFKKIENFDSILSVNEINNDLLENIEQMEPFGAGNPEPQFIIEDIKIDSVKIIKDKHLLIFFQNDFSLTFKAICFNCLGTILGDYLLNFRLHNLSIGCTIKKDNYTESLTPQIIIKDAILID